MGIYNNRYIKILSDFNKEEFLDILYKLCHESIDYKKLISDNEELAISKYDRFIPVEFLKKAYLNDCLCIDIIKNIHELYR